MPYPYVYPIPEEERICQFCRRENTLVYSKYWNRYMPALEFSASTWYDCPLMCSICACEKGICEPEFFNNFCDSELFRDRQRARRRREKAYAKCKTSQEIFDTYDRFKLEERVQQLQEEIYDIMTILTH